MRNGNLPSGAKVVTDAGFVWEEIQAPGSGDTVFKVIAQTTLRVSAGALTEVYLDGLLSMTLRPGEVERLNVGSGIAKNNTTCVEVAIVSVDAAVQKCLMVERGRFNP
jgi:hypothetical protein